MGVWVDWLFASAVDQLFFGCWPEFFGKLRVGGGAGLARGRVAPLVGRSARSFGVVWFRPLPCAVA